MMLKYQHFYDIYFVKQYCTAYNIQPQKVNYHTEGFIV